MEMTNPLTLITFIPLAGMIVVLFCPARMKAACKWIAAAATAPQLVIALWLYEHFDTTTPLMQFVEHYHWISTYHIFYFMGVDGISISMVLLTALICFISVFASFSIDRGEKGYYALLLMLDTGMMGVFVSLDFFLFYVFWEVMLLPMYFLIGIWGGPRREYAAIKFFLYTLLGSVLILLVMLGLYYYGANPTFDMTQLAAQSASYSITFQRICWIALFVGFAIKIPAFPFHTWLPDAHVEAPTAISVMLAGVLLKMGTYGLLRFNLGLFPEQSRHNAPWVMTLALIGIVYGALVAMVQPNMKKLIAYSSVSHLGFVVLGIFSFTQAGLNGAMFVMLAHGISTGALFLLAGILHERRHTYEISEFGGLASPMPVYAASYLVIVLASAGLPLLNGFIGEFLVLSGAFQAKAVYGILGATGIIWSAVYLLWMYQRVFYGKVTHPVNNSLSDLSGFEKWAVWPCAAAALVMGVAPIMWLGAIDPAVKAALSPVVHVASRVVGQ